MTGKSFMLQIEIKFFFATGSCGNRSLTIEILSPFGKAAGFGLRWSVQQMVAEKLQPLGGQKTALLCASGIDQTVFFQLFHVVL